MIPSIATVTMGGDLSTRISVAGMAGFEAVELFDADLDGEADDVVRRMLEDAGVAPASYFPLREIEGIARAGRQAAMDRAAAFMDRAAALGAPMIMMCSTTREDAPGDRDAILRDLHDTAALAAERGLRLAYEALAWGRHVADYRDALALIAEVDHPALGLVLDSFHIIARRLPMGPIAGIPAERIFLVQVSDAPWLDLGYLEWSRGHRVLPGQGDFDLAEFSRFVRATGYEGVVSLECFSDDLRARPARDVAAEGASALFDLWGDLAQAY